jgi:hypothetical protein
MKTLILTAALALAGCDSAQTPAPYFARAATPSNGSMEALMRGRLELRDGCVWIAPEGGGGQPLLVVWPAETEMQRSEETVRFRNSVSGSGASVGKRIEISGGEVEGLQPGALAEPIPSACAAGPFWVAGPTWTLLN